jgi:hypothetical protein
MAIQQKITRILAGGQLWVLPAAFSFLSLSWVAPTNAVETAPPNATSFLISQATQTKPAASRPRPRPAFFEEERRPRFGFGDFLNSALDGVDNSFSGDAVQNSPTITLDPVSGGFMGISGTLTVGINENIRMSAPSPGGMNVIPPTIGAPSTGGINDNPPIIGEPGTGGINENPPIIGEPGTGGINENPVSPRTASRTGAINGNLRQASSTDQRNNPGFLNGSFISTDGTNLQFSNVIPGSSPQRGTLTVQGNILINGVLTPVNGVREYSAGGNENNGFVSATVQLVDPKNPSQAIFIQVPATRNLGNRNTASGPANLSIGRPIDR